MGESINNVTESQINKPEEWDILRADFPFVSEEFGISIMGGIIASIIVVSMIQGWKKQIRPFIMKKTASLNSNGKIMLNLNIMSMVLGAILIGVGIMFAYPVIHVEFYMNSPNDEESKRFYDHLVNSFIVGMAFLVVGFIWEVLVLRNTRSLFSSDKYRKGSKYSPVLKPSNRDILRTLRNKRLFKKGLKCWRYINNYITKEKVIDIIIIEIGSTVVIYVIVVHFLSSGIIRLFWT